MTRSRLPEDHPLVYACSGFSNVAQLANKLAVELDRSGQAEMSCIAGVGADVPAIVKTAKSGRPVIALDGCPICCTTRCLARHGVEARAHHVFSDYGLKKERGDFDEETTDRVRQEILASLP